MPSSSTKSGIALSDSGERHIPSSKRADGTLRREIKVRPGYRPPEDVEIYKNRTAEAWKGGRGGAKPGAEVLNSSAEVTSATSKNAKRREARKRAAAVATEEGLKKDSNNSEDNALNRSSGIEISDIEKGVDKNFKADPPPFHGDKGENDGQDIDAENFHEKDARKLAKKLRQAKELKTRKERGDTLLPEQLEKVIRINGITKQLEGLGFDINGGKKSNT